MKRKQLFIRIMAIFLAVVLAATVLLSVLSSVGALAAPSRAELERLEREQEELQQQMQDIKAEINSLKYEEASVLAKKAVLDEQVMLTHQEIDNLTAQIAECENLIAGKEVEVKAAQKAEEDQWELYKIRMRAMEENGTISYYAIIFGANSFSDMLARLDVVSDIMNSDEKCYNDLIKAREETEAAKVALEEAKAEQEQKKSELETRQEDLEAQVEEATELILSIQENSAEYQEFYNEVFADEQEVAEQIKDMEEALAAQTGNYTGVVGTGRFIWPSQISNYITSRFGSRDQPTAGASTNHKGIDIGRVGYGSNILAADSGTVTVSQRSSSYGEYVVISHGNGYTTLYAHMSRRSVSVGDTVSQGDIVGLSGSTGVSNGPHLHFEVWYNGTRIDPLGFYDSSTYTLSPSA